jgi:osmotically-inducible protein OsmY
MRSLGSATKYLQAKYLRANCPQTNYPRANYLRAKYLRVDYLRMTIVAAVAVILAGAQVPAASAQAAEGNSVDSSSVTTEHERATLEGHHHYATQAERANDALLITEVKSALADDGVAEDSPIVVDCDHGKILLSGVMKSAEDAKRAGTIAANASGVVAVKNQLTWH